MRATVKKSKIVSGLKRLMSNERGNMALVVGMATMPMILIMGAAVDFENASNTQTELQTSVDSAALYAAALNETTDAALTTKSKPYFTANFNSASAAGAAATPTYTVTSVGDAITATASIPVNNSFMKMAGLPTTTVSATSVVKKAGINLEVSLVLDNTGSMGSINSKTGNTAISDLKVAAAKFVDQVMPATQGQFYTKIAAIPYNSSVNLGSSTLAIQARGSTLSGTSTTPGSDNYTFSSVVLDSKNKKGQWQICTNHDSAGYCQTTAAITNCVTERTGTAAYTDGGVATYPVGRKYVVTNSSFNPCTVTPMVPLSTDAAQLKSAIGAMSSGNWTAGQTGLAWGWYALSPNIGVFTGAAAPAGYDKLTTTDLTKKVRKVMILMTDAEYNSAYYNGVVSYDTPYTSYPGNEYELSRYSPTNGDVYNQAASMCSGIKASGVEVYVITFQLDKSLSWRVGLVNNCATDANHIIDADSTSLDAAFGKIANQILAMRIAQ